MNTEAAVGTRAAISESPPDGRPREGSPPGTLPRVETPWLARSQFQLTKMAPMTAIKAPGTFLVTYLAPRMTTMTEADTATVDQLIWSRFSRVLTSLPTVPLSVWPNSVMPVPSGIPRRPPT